MDYLTVALTVRDREVHRSRILDPTRDSGYRDVEKAWAWNSGILSRPPWPREILLDTTHDTVSQSIERVIKTIEG